MPAAALLQEGGKGHHGKDTGPCYARKDLDVVGLRLDRLEWLGWYCGRTSVESCAELVKCCPNLKSLELFSDATWSLDGLAESLRLHCRYLDSLKMPLCLKSPSFKTFLSRCSISGLRSLKIESHMSQEDLISGVLHHGSTLEDLSIDPTVDRLNGLTYLPLLTGCTKLKRFAFHASFDSFAATRNPLEAFKEEKWGCRGLHELDLEFGLLGSAKRITEENEQELRRMMFEAGWVMVPFSYQRYQFHLTYMSKVFELLDTQELEKLQNMDFLKLRNLRTLTLSSWKYGVGELESWSRYLIIPSALKASYAEALG
ncbi:MAG: hypothetical protein J3R72DRAFT_487379 [Linnemannia gamsii]|nr:MAG: hypothetical protein J3R72DRAFT_487379 [Linnemannia gamsii]